MTTDTENAEPIAGTNLTTVAEFNKTAVALSELETRLAKVVVDTSTKKGVESLTKDVAELRGLRTGVEKKRKELKAPLLADIEKLDTEAKRITAKIVALEEPLKLQLDEHNAKVEAARLAKEEENRARIEKLTGVIREIREKATSLIGKPSSIINGALVALTAIDLQESEFAEYYDEAIDAKDAAVSRIMLMLNDAVAAEKEAERVRLELAELATLRAEKEARDAADRQKAIDDELERVEKAAAAQAAAEAQEQLERDNEARRVQAIRQKIDQISFVPPIANQAAGYIDDFIKERVKDDPRDADNTFDFAEFQSEACDAFDAALSNLHDTRRAAVQREREEYEASERRAKEERELRAERERQAEAQKQLDAQAEQLRKDKAAAEKKAEELRLASLGLREAAQAVIAFVKKNCYADQVFDDLAAALANDAKATPAPAARKRTKVTK